jgi:lysine-specific demethylase/histidyl-hydroxylase NO66
VNNATKDPLQLVTGLSVGEFATPYWGVAPLLQRAAPLSADRFAGLLSLDAIDELLSRRGLRTPFLRMSRNGEVLTSSRFTRGGGAGAEITDQVADDKVLAEFAAGATLVLQGLHRTWPPLQQFAGALSAQLGQPVQVNAYVTPPQSKGFEAHYDVHDVFVLQLAGSKHWRIHEPVLPSPLRDQPWHERKSAVDARCAEAPAIDSVLERGDSLYLPRGYIHAAESLGEVSAHLTVGVHPVTRWTLVEQVLAALRDDADLRLSLPVGVDLANEDVLRADLKATVTAMHEAIDRLDSAAVARAVGRHLSAAARPSPLRPLRQFSEAATLTAKTAVRLRPGLRVTFRSEGAHLVLELPDKEVPIPATVAEVARAATSGMPVTADSLTGIEEREAVALLSQLLLEGVLVPA